MALLCVWGRGSGEAERGRRSEGGGAGGPFQKMEGSTLKSEEPVGGASETGATATAAGTGRVGEVKGRAARQLWRE